MMKRTLVSLALLALAGSFAQAQSLRLAVSPDSKLWLQGGSNLHSWECSSSTLNAAIDVADTFRTATEFTKALDKVEVKVPVRSIKCGHGGMDNNLYKALKADDDPQVSYVLGTFASVPGSASDYVIHTVGQLTVAGESREVKMDVTAARLPDGSVRAEGSLPIRMTDYGIKPPTALFGTLRTKNEVVVKFTLHVTVPTAVAAVVKP